MSLWSTDTLHAYCAPGGVWALRRRGWRRQVAGWRHVPVREEGTNWQPAVAALGALLPEFGCARLRVTLSSRFVQYRRIAWRDDLRGDREFEALAKLEFANAYGALADAWRVVLSDEAPGQSRIAAAVPQGLLTALDELAAAGHARLAAVPPGLTFAATCLPDAATGVQCLVAWEPGQLCIALRDGGDWCWIRQRRVGEDWWRELPGLLEEESQLSGLDVEPRGVRVFAPGLGREEEKWLGEAGYAPSPQASPVPVTDVAARYLAWCA